jgi:DNA-binding SARP family transcriptional activator
MGRLKGTGAVLIKIKAFGRFEVYHGDMLIHMRPRQMLLLQILLCAQGALDTNRVVELLWHRPTGGSRKTLHGQISKIRKAVEAVGGGKEDLIVTVNAGEGRYLYQLADGIDIDVDRFRQQVAAGCEAYRLGLIEQAAWELAVALTLAPEEPLHHIKDKRWAAHYVQQLTEEWKNAIITRIEADISLGRHREVAGELKTLVSHWPGEDDLKKLLIVVLYRSGRDNEALDYCQLVINAKRAQGHNERVFLDLQRDVLRGDLPRRGPLTPVPTGRRGLPSSPDKSQRYTVHTDLPVIMISSWLPSRGR